MKELTKILDEIEERASDSERWVNIKGSTGYQISNMGRVRSLLNRGNHKEKLGKDYKELSQSTCKKQGYKSVNIYSEYLDKFHTQRIHQLVAHAFVNGKRFKGYQVAHLDGNPANNKSTNLKICTPKENASHKKLHGTELLGSKKPNSLLQDWQIDEIRFLASKSIPQMKIAELFNINRPSVSEIVNMKAWTHVTTREDIPRLTKALRNALEGIELTISKSIEVSPLEKHLIEILKGESDDQNLP